MADEVSNLYLILHKVRGLPAFDIAERCEDMGTVEDPGPWWIIPTSGHRAHPLRSWLLSELSPELDLYSGRLSIGLQDLDSWPDHYQVTSAPKAKGILDSIVAKLSKPIGSIRRI